MVSKRFSLNFHLKKSSETPVGVQPIYVRITVDKSGWKYQPKEHVNLINGMLPLADLIDFRGKYKTAPRVC